MNYLNKKYSIPLLVICFMGMFVGEVYGEVNCCMDNKYIGVAPYYTKGEYHDSHARLYCRQYLSRFHKYGPFETCYVPDGFDGPTDGDRVKCIAHRSCMRM